MDALTPDEMLKLVAQHSLYEYEQDLDKIMGTLVAHPIFEMHPQGLRIEGEEAVRAFYSAILKPIVLQLETRRRQPPEKPMKSLAFSESHMVGEIDENFEFTDGRVRSVRMLAIVDFEDGVMLGERIFVDSEFAKEFDLAWGPSFLTVPGVSLIANSITST